MLKNKPIRGVVMFIMACFTSPCCTPLVVPLAITLLAGTPVALWMSHNLGVVYGGLTLISVISFVLAFRWMGKRKSRPPIRPSSDIPLSSIFIGENANVE